MPRLLMTTILVSALSTGVAFAQTPGPEQKSKDAESSAQRVIPEGFTLQEEGADLGALIGAELFDVMDAQIGTIVELISPEASEASDAKTSGASSAAATDAAATGDAAGTAAAADEKTVGDGEPMDADATGTSGVGPLAGAGTGDTVGTVVDTEVEGTPPEPAEDAVEVSPAPEAGGDGASSHAIIELDNFPGVGQHRIAVPLSELQIYRNDRTLRVYISRSRDELLALPAYNPSDRATLGGPKVE